MVKSDIVTALTHIIMMLQLLEMNPLSFSRVSNSIKKSDYITYIHNQSISNFLCRNKPKVGPQPSEVFSRSHALLTNFPPPPTLSLPSTPPHPLLPGSVRRNSTANSRINGLSANHRIADRDYLGWMDFGRRSAEEYEYSS